MNPKSMQTQESILDNAALGLAGEAGESADLIKKWLHHDRPLDVDKARKEAGDVLFYVALYAKGLGVNLSDIAQENIDKLTARYPSGHFTAQDSINKADENN